MKITEISLYDYKSIIEADIKIQPDITCLVGTTGAGKTSILELMHRISNEIGFSQEDLPQLSDTRKKFQSSEITAKEIIQLRAKFEIEEIDKQYLPEYFDGIKYIGLTRFFDGSWDIELIQTGNHTLIEYNLEDEIRMIEESILKLETVIESAKSRIPDMENHQLDYNNAKESFLKLIPDNPEEIIALVTNFKNSLFALPHDGTLKEEFDTEVAKLEAYASSIQEKLSNSPYQQIYDLLPKPEYIPQLPELSDRISLDDYLNSPNDDPTFSAIGMICNFNKSELNNIRNSESPTRINYFNVVSDKLTREFASFWSQAKYKLIIGLEGNDLIFSVWDETTKKTTKATQRSEGLKWVIALFCKIKLLVSSKGSSHILLFDSPATAVHDAGKEEIRKFLIQMAEQNHLQIIYTTHEKALIDPWRLDRIRFVDKKEHSGTKILEVKDNGIDSTRIEISKHIGSPAKYSLFGSPITVFFEGSSDYKFVAALNEYSIRNDKKYLHPDVYTIDDIGGIDNVYNLIKILKNLGLEYIFVVDGGSKAKTIERKIGDEKLTKNIIQITDVIRKQTADIEDLIDPKLYEYLFKKTYPDVAMHDSSRLEGQKAVTYYGNILKEAGHSGLNKTGIAALLMNVLNDVPEELKESIHKTINQYEKLVDIIEEKIKKD